jgi:hypothetical protein
MSARFWDRAVIPLGAVLALGAMQLGMALLGTWPF